MILLLAIALALTPARCESISRNTYSICRWPNVDPFAHCDHLNKLFEACKPHPAAPGSTRKG